jgi:molybdopterin/thiamine biosynthesis adenylyltransferase
MTENAQSQLAAARVVLLGLNGPASACAVHLVESGLGHITLIDGLRVDEMDLAEQFIYSESNVGDFRVEAAKKFLTARNPKLTVEAVREPFTAHSAERLLSSADIVVDALDDWQSKVLASDVCMQLGRTLVHCGIRGFEFHIYTMIPGRSACLRCVLQKTGLEDMVSTPFSSGAFGPLSGMAGSFQAIEVIKLIIGLGTTPGNHLIKFDALRRDFDDVTDLNPRPDCPDCGRPF